MADLTRRKALGLLAAVSLPPTAVVGLSAAAKAEETPVSPTIEQALSTMTNEEQAYYHLKLCAKALKAEFGGNWDFGLSIEHQAGYVVAANHRK